MPNFPSSSRVFRFGLFEADVENARLTRKGVRIKLQEQPFRILALLLDRAGQIVTREELRNELWPSGTYVDFDGSLNAALKRLRAALGDDADNPTLIETVPKRGYRFIAPRIVQEHATAPEMQEIAPAPVPVFSVATPLSAIPTSSLSRKLRRMAAITAVLAASIALVLWFTRRRTGTDHGSPALNVVRAESRRSVAVLGFHNVSGRAEDAWLSTALTEMLRTELGAGNKLRVIPGEDVTQFRMTAPWSETDSLSQETSAKIGRVLDGDLLVLGSYVTVGDQQDGTIRVDFRLQQAQTGEILYEGADAGTVKQLFGLVAKIGMTLRQRLELPLVTESEEVSVLSSLPAGLDAGRFYSLGLEKMRRGDLTAARDLFLQAERIAPQFPLVHTMLARCWGGLGYDQKARAEAKKGFDLSQDLPQTEKLLVEGTYYGTIRNSEKAVETYRALYSLYPDSVDYAEQLIVSLNGMGRHEEALGIVSQLRQLPPPASDDPRIDYWQAQLMSYSKSTGAQALFEKAVAEASSRGQKLLYARFRLDQCINRVYGDHPEGATPFCREAYDIFTAAGNRLYAADALRAIGDRQGAKGDFTSAREFYHRALALLNQLGEHEKTGVVLNNMAITYENQNQIAESEKLFRQAAETWRECGDTLREGMAIGNLADVSLERGRLRDAENQYENARKQIEAADPEVSTAYELYSIAGVRLYLGDVPGAMNYAKEALATAEKHKSPPDTAASEAALGDIQTAAGDIAGARRTYEQALSIRQQLGNKQNIAENQASLADLAIEEGKLAEGETTLRKSLAEFQSENTVMDEIRANSDLARALRLQGKLQEARSALSAALNLSRNSRDPSLTLPVRIEDARIETALLKGSAAPSESAGIQSKLQDVIRTANRLDYYSIECEARLALAELELRTNSKLAPSHLAALALNAHARGLELIARKAAALAKPPARAPQSKSPAI